MWGFQDFLHSSYCGQHKPDAIWRQHLLPSSSLFLPSSCYGGESKASGISSSRLYRKQSMGSLFFFAWQVVSRAPASCWSFRKQPEVPTVWSCRRLLEMPADCKWFEHPLVLEWWSFMSEFSSLRHSSY